MQVTYLSGHKIQLSESGSSKCLSRQAHSSARVFRLAPLHYIPSFSFTQEEYFSGHRVQVLTEPTSLLKYPVLQLQFGSDSLFVISPSQPNQT